MVWDVALLNWIFIIFSSLIMFSPAKRVFKYQSKTLADYTILLIYLFNCFPVILDVTVGIPNYVYWYDVFENVLADFYVCFIYNSYVTAVMLCLGWYASKMSHSSKVVLLGESNVAKWRNKYIDFLLILSPIIIVLATVGLSVFSEYTLLTRRNTAGLDTSFVNQLIMVSVFFYVTRFFETNRNRYEYVMMFLFFFILIWINGKRYIIVTILEEIIYMYQLSKRNQPKRLNLWLMIPLVLIGTVIFSAFYLTNVKITQGSNYLYGTLRVDFGRDNVTKFVIKDVLLNGNDIVEYPGQTFLSALFMFVPRSIWAGKPYPHYRYLTAAIHNKSIFNIPSGTTPSLFEMSLCNFGWFGFPITPVLLILLCKFGDKNKDRSTKLIYLLLITNLLTQALDVMTSLLLILFISEFVSRVRFRTGKR